MNKNKQRKFLINKKAEMAEFKEIDYKQEAKIFLKRIDVSMIRV